MHDLDRFHLLRSSNRFVLVSYQMARRVPFNEKRNTSAPSLSSGLSEFGQFSKAEKLLNVEEAKLKKEEELQKTGKAKAKKEEKDDDDGATATPAMPIRFFATLNKDIRKCFSNNFCTMADAIDTAVLKHFDSSLSSRELLSGEIDPDLRQLVITEKEDFQNLMEIIFESLNAVLDEYGQRTEPKCLRNVLLPLCVHLVPSVLGELLMARRFDTSMVNLIFDFTKCDDFISFFPGRDPQDIKELYFSAYPTDRLLRSITNFLSTTTVSATSATTLSTTLPAFETPTELATVSAEVSTLSTTFLTSPSQLSESSWLSNL